MTHRMAMAAGVNLGLLPVQLTAIVLLQPLPVPVAVVALLVSTTACGVYWWEKTHQQARGRREA